MMTWGRWRNLSINTYIPNRQKKKTINSFFSKKTSEFFMNLGPSHSTIYSHQIKMTNYDPAPPRQETTPSNAACQCATTHLTRCCTLSTRARPPDKEQPWWSAWRNGVHKLWAWRWNTCTRCTQTRHLPRRMRRNRPLASGSTLRRPCHWSSHMRSPYLRATRVRRQRSTGSGQHPPK